MSGAKGTKPYRTRDAEPPPPSTPLDDGNPFFVAFCVLVLLAIIWFGVGMPGLGFRW